MKLKVENFGECFNIKVDHFGECFNMKNTYMHIDMNGNLWFEYQESLHNLCCEHDIKHHSEHIAHTAYGTYISCINACPRSACSDNSI